MAYKIDRQSALTIGRFALKFNVALLVAHFMEADYAHSVARCLELFAIWMAIMAMLSRERFASDTLNHWSEALWLSFSAAGLRLASQAAS